MLTGKKAFGGDDSDETVSDVLAAVLKSEPDWERIPQELPKNIKSLLFRCLHKDPHERLRDIGDARYDLAQPSHDYSEKEPAEKGAKQTVTVGWKLATFLFFLLSVIGWAFAFWWSNLSNDDHSPDQIQQFAFELSEEEQISMDIDIRMFDISDDGSTIAWISPQKPKRRILYRKLNSLEVQSVPGSEGVRDLDIALSSDGSEVLFVRDGSLWKMSLEGGTPQKIYEGENQSSIWTWDWGQDGSIVISIAYRGLISIPHIGANPLTLTELNSDDGEISHLFPCILPDGKGVLFTIERGSFYFTDVEALIFNGSSFQRKKVLFGTSFVEYVPTGHLLFGRQGTVLAVPFDSDTGTVTGPEVALLSNIQTDSYAFCAQFRVSQTGTLLYIPEQGLELDQLAWCHRNGGFEKLSLPPGNYQWPRIPPKGTSVLTAARLKNDRHYCVSEVDLKRLSLQKIGPVGYQSRYFEWNRDGSLFALSSAAKEGINLSLQYAGDSEPFQDLMDCPGQCAPTSWNPEGNVLFFTERLPFDHFRIGKIDLRDQELEPVIITQGSHSEQAGVVSPDGRWMAFISDHEGSPEVYIREIAQLSRQPYRVSKSGGWQPCWSRDGSELFYLSGDVTKLVSARLRLESEVEVLNESVVFDEPSGYEFRKLADMRSLGRSCYDVALDDQRFLVSLRERKGEMEVVVVLNWFEELNRLVPTE
jgi:serine/threonine-protein kinase